MAWIKVESSVSRNRKFVQAGPAPSWLWLCGLAYCQEGLTDGFIPHEALTYLGVKNAPQLAAHLVKAGLWDVDEGGWRVHDYLEHNKPASDIRRIHKERSAGGKLGGRPNLQGKPSATDKVNHTENPAVPERSRSVPEAEATAGERKPRAEPLRDSTPVVLMFPTVGAPSTWDLHQSRIDAWSKLYPGLDVLAECREAFAWAEANATKRKTANGMPAFLVRWFGKSVNNPRAGGSAGQNGLRTAGNAATLQRFVARGQK